MTDFGHNEHTASLGLSALRRISHTRESIIEGWISAGGAFCEAADLCQSNRVFSEWLKESNLHHISTKQISAAMWAYQNQCAFREAYIVGNVNTPSAAVNWAKRKMRNDVRDFVYIMTNPSMPGMVKIGMTKCSPEVRAVQLSQTSGIPTPFSVFSEFRTFEAETVEKEVHLALEGTRVNSSREFFNVTPEEAYAVIKDAVK
jgi:hypothetical protein